MLCHELPIKRADAEGKFFLSGRPSRSHFLRRVSLSSAHCRELLVDQKILGLIDRFLHAHLLVSKVYSNHKFIHSCG